MDILIKKAKILDGSAAPGWVGDVAVSGSHIADVAPEIDVQAKTVIQGEGLVLAPGFTDIHGHSDLHLLDHPDARIKLRQGVTLDTGGNCGFSLAPLATGRAHEALRHISSILGEPENPLEFQSFGEYANLLERRGLTTNMACFVGHGTLRVLAMGFSDAVPTQEQAGVMKRLLAESLEQGAAGLSTGLIYLPACYAKTAELIEMAKVLSGYGGLYLSHIRNESDRVLQAVREAIHIGREAGVAVQISHLKVSGPGNWPLAEQVVEEIEAARRSGLDITCDVYPYTCASTTLAAILPPWALVGGANETVKRLEDTDTRRRMREDMIRGIEGWQNNYQDVGWEKTTVAAVRNESLKELEGRTLADLADEAGKDPFDYAFDLLKDEQCAVVAIYEMMDPSIVESFLSLPYTMVGSDGVPAGSKPHPRLYGTFPRVVGRFAGRKRVFPMEEAVRKMTSQPNERLGIGDRGRIQTGYKADLVLFDPKTFIDNATYQDPCRHPDGLAKVLVNGVVVFDGHRHTGRTPGQFISRP